MLNAEQIQVDTEQIISYKLEILWNEAKNRIHSITEMRWGHHGKWPEKECLTYTRQSHNEMERKTKKMHVVVK